MSKKFSRNKFPWKSTSDICGKKIDIGRMWKVKPMCCYDTKSCQKFLKPDSRFNNSPLLYAVHTYKFTYLPTYLPTYLTTYILPLPHKLTYIVHQWSAQL
jgi:hypothetical protein